MAALSGVDKHSEKDSKAERETSPASKNGGVGVFLGAFPFQRKTVLGEFERVLRTGVPPHWPPTTRVRFAILASPSTEPAGRLSLA